MSQSIKNLKDSTTFRLSESSRVNYRLDKLHPKQRMATYTSLKSGRTFTSGWGKKVWL